MFFSVHSKQRDRRALGGLRRGGKSRAGPHCMQGIHVVNRGRVWISRNLVEYNIWILVALVLHRTLEAAQALCLQWVVL